GDSAVSDRVTIIPDYYSEAYTTTPADFICSRHVLEHIADPVAFLRMVRRAIGDRVNTAVFFEVPNMAYTLHNMAIWDIIYEHCSYFTPQSLRYLFTRCGFRVLAVNTTYAGQFLTIEAMPDDASSDLPAGEHIQELETAVSQFGRHLQEKITHWQHTLHSLHQQNQHATIWGVGSKGVTFLNLMDTARQIPYAIDINPRKHGKYVTGTGQPIHPPEHLQQHPPDLIILMNPIYQDEIRQMTSNMGLSPKFTLA
ncbi:MAG: methyltransferase domain-containing protein, partial [Chloroflexi bacterium]